MRTELEGMTMDVKKFFADLVAMYRKPTEPPSPASVVDVDAAHEAGRKAGYEAGYKKGYDEGFQIALETEKTPEAEPPPPKSESEPLPPKSEL